MGHTLSERQLQQRLQKYAGTEIAHEVRGRAREARHKHRIVNLWNARLQRGLEPSFYPTIATAIAAGMPWLQVLCPACQTIGEVDLRTLDRHGRTAIGSLIPSLSCRGCRRDAPFARLIGLSPQSNVPTLGGRSESFEVMAQARKERR